MSKVKTRCSFNNTAFQAVAFCAKVMRLSVEDYIAMCCLRQTEEFIKTMEEAKKEREANGSNNDARGAEEEAGGAAQEGQRNGEENL